MNKKRNHGFTLVEVLLYVALSGGLILVLASFLNLSTTAKIKNQSITEVNQQGFAALEHITHTIRNATGVTTPSIGTTTNTLSVTVPSVAQSPSVFSLNGTTVQVQEGGSAGVALTSGSVQISSLSFKNLSSPGTPGVIQVSFTVSRTNTAGRAEFSYQKTFTTSVALR